MKLIGILNLTPDSFSDGGRNVDMRTAFKRMEGAYAVDVGAESTRPGATPVSPQEEWARLEPFFLSLHPGGELKISIDTRHPETAVRALAAGADWINDVSGFANPAMVEAVQGSDCTLAVMHSLTVPADPAVTLPEGVDVIAALTEFFTARVAALTAAGIARARMVLDPGLGFGKTAAQSWEIVHRIAELKALGLPLLVGHSRKSFLGVPMEERDAATLALSKQLIAAGVDYLRVHDVAGHLAL